MDKFSLESNNMDFSSGKSYNSNFRPKFYVIFFIVFSMYYFFSPILSGILFNFIDNYLRFLQLTLINDILHKFIVPNVSLFIFLLLYILIIEERKPSFLFIGFKSKFLVYSFRGLLLALSLVLILIFVFIVQDNILFFRVNREFTFINIFQLIVVFVCSYIKYFLIECFYRGWLINIFNHRYSVYLSIIFTSILYLVISFIEYRRIGIYLIYIFIFNLFISFLFLIYNNIFLVISFHCCYDFLKRYVLSLESSNIKLNTLFYTAIDNNNVIYNVENSMYAVLIISVFALVSFGVYTYLNKSKR